MWLCLKTAKFAVEGGHWKPACQATLAAARARAADVPRCLLACQPTNQRPHGGAAGRARAIKKGSPTIISTVVSGDSVQQNDLRGQVDLIGPGS